MMKEYFDNNSFGKNEQHEKPKRRSPHRSKKGVFVLCCLTVIILFVSLFVSNFPFADGEQSNENYSAKALIAADFSIGPPADAPGVTNEAQSNVADAPGIADAAPGNSADTQNNINETAWSLILINEQNSVPDNYNVELKELSNGQSVDIRIYPALQEMFDTARSEGIYPTVIAGYRTAEKQQSLLDSKAAEYMGAGYSAEEAKAKALGWVALPGASEHQIGIAVDIVSDRESSTDEEVYEWLCQNAHTFGFILRYPSDKTEITGINNEPWHYRYVGVEAAAQMHRLGICLEEYLGKVN